MKTFTEFVGKEEPTNTTTTFPTFEEATNEMTESSCVSEKMKALIKDCMESAMMEMKACHEDETEMTAENYMSEYDSCMKESMESLKEYMKSCTK
jgi:hypothetical protein